MSYDITWTMGKKIAAIFPLTLESKWFHFDDEEQHHQQPGHQQAHKAASDV